MWEKSRYFENDLGFSKKNFQGLNQSIENKNWFDLANVQFRWYFCLLWFIHSGYFFFLRGFFLCLNVRCCGIIIFFSSILFISFLFTLARQSNRYLKQYIRQLKSGKLKRDMCIRARQQSIQKVQENWVREYTYWPMHWDTHIYVKAAVVDSYFFFLSRFVAFFISVCALDILPLIHIIRGPRWLYSWLWINFPLFPSHFSFRDFISVWFFFAFFVVPR